MADRTDLLILDGVLSDRGSKYAVAGAPAHSKAEADALLKALKRNKKFAKATHNTWALLLPVAATSVAWPSSPQSAGQTYNS